jgi:hypothetical protein
VSKACRAGAPGDSSRRRKLDEEISWLGRHTTFCVREEHDAQPTFLLQMAPTELISPQESAGEWS